MTFFDARARQHPDTYDLFWQEYVAECYLLWQKQLAEEHFGCVLQQMYTVRLEDANSADLASEITFLAKLVRQAKKRTTDPLLAEHDELWAPNRDHFERFIFRTVSHCVLALVLVVRDNWSDVSIEPIARLLDREPEEDRSLEPLALELFALARKFGDPSYVRTMISHGHSLNPVWGRPVLPKAMPCRPSEEVQYRNLTGRDGWYSVLKIGETTYRKRQKLYGIEPSKGAAKQRGFTKSEIEKLKGGTPS